MKNKKIFSLFVYIGILIFLVCGLTGSIAYAQDNYRLLAPLPYQNQQTTQVAPTDFAGYASGLIRLIIGIATVLAVIMFIFGGFMYMTSESLSSKGAGRETMTNAVGGLVLLLASWLILYSINPDLLSLDLTIPTPNQIVDNGSGTGGGVGGGGTGGGVGSGGTGGGVGAPGGVPCTTVACLNHNNALTTLAASGINVTCTQPNASNCVCADQNNCLTSLTNIRQSTVDGTLALQNACFAVTQQSCTFTITGGTEIGPHGGGTFSHGSGFKVDIGFVTGSTFNKSLLASGGLLTTAYNGIDRGIRSDNAPTYTFTVGDFLAQNSGRPHIDQLQSAFSGLDAGTKIIIADENAIGKGHWDIAIIPPTAPAGTIGE